MDPLQNTKRRIAYLENALSESEQRADTAVEDRDNSERAQEKLLDDLIALQERYKELQKSSTDELKALQERYITALATASEKTNRAKEAIAERDILRKRKNEIVAEEVERAKEQFEIEKSELLDDLKHAKDKYEKEKVDLQNTHDDVVKKLEQSAQTYRKEWMESEKKVKSLQIILNDANRRMEITEKEMLTIKRERDFFDRIISENASVTGCDNPNEIVMSPQTLRNGKPKSSDIYGPGNNMPAPSCFIYPQITPPPDVDPFALLSSCDGAKRKVPDSIAGQLERLRAAYEKCNKKRLADQTWGLFDAFDLRECDLCKVPLKVSGVSNFIDHISGKKHSTKLNGAACADAFDFWWSAIETATFDEPLPQPAIILQTKRGFKEWRKENEMRKTMKKYKNECECLKKTLEEVADRLVVTEKEKGKLKDEVDKERARVTQLENEMEEMKRFWEDLGEGIVRKRPRTESIKEEPEDDLTANKEDDVESAEEGEVVDWEVKLL